MGAETGSSVDTIDHWELLVVFGFAFLSVLLPSGIVTSADPTLLLGSALVTLVVAFVVTVGYERLFTGNSDRRSAFWTGVKTAYPVALGVYLLAIVSGFVSGAPSTIQTVVVLLAAFIGLASAVLRVRFRG